MEVPESYIAAMNAQCMTMSGSSRRGRGADKKKDHTRVLRTMKRLVGKVRQHGKRYWDLLLTCRNETDLSMAQAQLIRVLVRDWPEFQQITVPKAIGCLVATDHDLGTHASDLDVAEVRQPQQLLSRHAIGEHDKCGGHRLSGYGWCGDGVPRFSGGQSGGQQSEHEGTHDTMKGDHLVFFILNYNIETRTP